MVHVTVGNIGQMIQERLFVKLLKLKINFQEIKILRGIMYGTYVTMMNKLIYGQKFILRPLLNGLRNQNNAASFRRIEELETKIENNMEQSQMLTGLMAKGYLEPALFNKEKN